MTPRLASRFTGGSFVLAGVLFWLGWALLPRRVGAYFQPADFAAIHDHLWLWIWMYRLHIFGMVLTALALLSLAALLADRPERVVIGPGAGVAAAGMFVTALAAAFYYHHGAWGALELNGQGTAECRQFVANLRVDTEYVTCFVRFGRVFTGLGLVVLAGGLFLARQLPRWVAGGALVLGLAAMGLTMALPEQLHLYLPLLHLHAVWLLATGIAIWRSELGTS